MVFPRYSQTVPSDAGALDFVGDLYRPDRSLAELANLITSHLIYQFPDNDLKLTKSLSGSRRHFQVAIVRTPTDLTDPIAREDLFSRIADQVYRFGYDRSNILSDQYHAAFSVRVSIDSRYWARRQKTYGADLIAETVKVSAFKKMIKAGDILEVLNGANLGRRHEVLEIGTRFVTDDGLTKSGRYFWDFPPSDAFQCDGERIRIAQGSEKSPDAYQLLRWHRTP